MYDSGLARTCDAGHTITDLDCPHCGAACGEDCQGIGQEDAMTTTDTSTRTEAEREQDVSALRDMLNTAQRGAQRALENESSAEHRKCLLLCRALERAIAAIKREAELRAALEPFVDAANTHVADDPAWTDNAEVWIPVSIRDLRTVLRTQGDGHE